MMDYDLIMPFEVSHKPSVIVNFGILDDRVAYSKLLTCQRTPRPTSHCTLSFVSLRWFCWSG